jgi:cell division septation protein DedD
MNRRAQRRRQKPRFLPPGIAWGLEKIGAADFFQLTRAVLVIMSVMLVAGCSRERIDWKSAEAADTQEAYNHFLELHPDSALATQAHTRLAQLAEDKDWQHASAADTADSYKQFLAQHPNGKWAEEARIRMENFSLDSNPSPASVAADVSTAPPASSATHTTAASGTTKPTSTPKAAASPSPAKQTVTPGPASKPVTTASTDNSGGYGIQLGAFSTQAAALNEWKRLQVTHDADLHGLFAHAVPLDVTSGKLYRLQAPVGDEGRARSICASLTKKQTPCVVVLPPAKR